MSFLHALFKEVFDVVGPVLLVFINALSWFQSYLLNRSFLINIGGRHSGVVPLTCGVPRGSILALMLFSLYVLPLGSIFEKHGLYYHYFYADDMAELESNELHYSR